MRRLSGLLVLARLGAPSPLVAQAVHHGCPVAGDAAGPARALNRLKNRDAAPSPAEIDSAVTLAAMAAPGGPRNWRATAWEVHPVTALTVVPRPP
jgi:hypothetical protein